MNWNRLVRNLCLAILILGLGGCEFNCSVGGTGSVIKDIRKQLEKHAGQEVTLQCADINKDGPTPCTVRLASGEEFRIEIKPAKERDMYDWQAVDLVLTGEKAALDMKQVFQQTYQIALENVTCPELMVLKGGVDATCQARSQGVDVVVKTIANPDGKSAKYFGTKGFILASRASQLAVDTFAKQNIHSTLGARGSHCTHSRQRGRS